MSHMHDHGHDHAHSHGHGPDCPCGCHNPGGADPARKLLEGALVLSRSWSRTSSPAIPAAELADRVAGGLRHIAALLAENGVVFGHIKALLRCGTDSVTFSITRLDNVDRITVGGWPPPQPVEAWELTVNVLSLVDNGTVDYALLEELFGPR